MQQNFMLSGDPLSLDRIRSTLIRLEDTIIFALIERAQFAYNPKIYGPGGIKELADTGFKGSWLEWFLKETEAFHAKARRFTGPDEYPFTSDLPEPLIPSLQFPSILHPNSVNVNASILSHYTSSVVRRITLQATQTVAAQKRALGIPGDNGEHEDDGNYGSAATLDVEILQAISKRIHYGKFVAESKFKSDPATFIPHILEHPNPQALGDLITKPAVERALLHRVRNKTSTYGQDFGANGQPTVSTNGNDASVSVGIGAGKIEVEAVVDLYENYIIPITKDVEVEYLLRRLDGLSSEEIGSLAKQTKK